MSRLAPAMFAVGGVLLGAIGCADCRQSTGATDATPSANPPSAAVQPPPTPPPLTWQARDEARGIGVPAGCRLLLPIQNAKLPAGQVRFAAARSDVGQLALALAAPGSPTVSHSGVIAPASPTVHPLPWFELDRPPAFDRTAKGWVAAFTRGDGTHAPVLWSEHGQAVALASGDQLAVADVLCHGATCAVLTTLARAAAAPGATLHLIGPDSKGVRVDIEADPAVSWQPLAIASFDGAEARVVLKAKAAAAIWSVTKERSSKLSELKTEFGVYDALSSKNTLIVAPGIASDTPCKGDQFPIRIFGKDGKESVVQSQAAPESLVIRAIDQGALLLWVAPIGCSNADRTLVYATLLDANGSPLGSVMSVADAVGFAAATSGSELALSLRTAEGLSFVRARCSAAAAP